MVNLKLSTEKGRRRLLPRLKSGVPAAAIFMEDIIRFGVSISAKLLDRFDRLIAEQSYTNRSEAIRDLIRDRLVEAEWKTGEGEMIGTITLVYNHHVRELTDKLTKLQHQEHHAIVSSMHVHLTEHHCLEVLVARGKSHEVQSIADKLISTKGVRHGKLTMTTAGEGLS